MAPFKDSYELNIEALKENIRFIMDGRISNGKGFIICPCGTGEYVTLSREEHKMMVEAAVEVAGNKLLVVAGVQSCNYREAIELALNAAEAGYISGAGVFWPEFEARYWNLLEQRKYEEAEKWRAKLGPYYEFIEGGDSPRAEGAFEESSGVKAALEYVGLHGGPIRPPFIELTKEQKNKLFGVLKDIGVPKKR